MKAPLTLLFLICSMLTFGQASITGIVVDERKEPVPFATILSTKAPLQGTTTDIDGKFNFPIPDSLCHREIEFTISFIGYQNELLIYNSGCKPQNEDTVVLQFAQQMLECVVVGSVAMKVEEAYLFSAPGVIKSKHKNKSTYSFTEENTEYYKGSPENPFQNVQIDPMTTMSIDVDHASYTNVRRMLNEGKEVPTDAVRIEEMINYFNYNYPNPAEGEPYRIYTETGTCPWNPQHQLLLVGLKAKSIPSENLPPSNFVFLLDVSGSMQDANKLPLVKSSLKLLVNNLREQDRVSIVVYAGAAGEVLKSTSGSNKQKILEAIDALQAGGSTAGGEGIQLAYSIAQKNFIKDGNNRIILCTDGDFNVGISSDTELEELIKSNRDQGIYLTCLGYGMGNLKDSKLELLADKGNGNYGYIDNMQEANKMLVTEFGGTMHTVAKDMKMQIEFNPTIAAAYRLIGYENRLLADEDFKNDKVDAGDLGAGQMVTTLYEIIPVGVEDSFTAELPKFKYQELQLSASYPNEVATIKVRYKEPDKTFSTEASYPVLYSGGEVKGNSDDFRFASSVALFGMLLQDSKYTGNGNYQMVTELATQSKGTDPDGYRAEFARISQVVHE